jgi:hypothetical protein
MMRWVRHAARMKEIRSVYEILLGKLKFETHFARPSKNAFSYLLLCYFASSSNCLQFKINLCSAFMELEEAMYFNIVIALT